VEKHDHLGAVYHGDTERDSSPTSKNFVPDLTEAARFLRLLDPGATEFLFASFTDKGNAKQAPWHRLGSLGDAAAALSERQANGAGVFVTVNEMRSARRRNSEVTRIRAVFADLDAGPEPTRPWPIEPSVIVRSSITPHDKSHVYFLVDPVDPLTPDEFDAIQATIVGEYGGDKAARDRSRTLRLPGSWHLKHVAEGAKPHLVTIVGGSGRRYTRGELLAAFPPAQKRPKPAPRTHTASPATGKAGGLDDRLLDALRHIDPTAYDVWIRVGAALYGETAGSGDGYAAWRDWSARSENFEERACSSRWATFASRASGPRAGAGSIIHLAREAGWRPSVRTKAPRPPLLVQHGAEPTYPAPKLSVDEARAELRKRVDDFGDRVARHWQTESETPPVLALPVGVGLGKSAAAREMIANLIKSGAIGGRAVVYSVPSHRLGAEQLDAFSGLGIRAANWRGRDAPDPSLDDPGKLMCLDPDAARDARLAGVSVQMGACRSEIGDKVFVCPHFAACGYQRQRTAVAGAQVIVVAHDSLFYRRPDEVGEVGLVVIDEAFWPSGIVGADKPVHATVDSIDPGRGGGVVCYDRAQREDTAATSDLRAARAVLMDAISRSGGGPLKFDAMTAAGLTEALCRQAGALEYRRLRDAGIRPGQTQEERQRRIAAVRPEAGVPWVSPRLAAVMWRLVGDAIAKRHDAASVQLDHHKLQDGSGTVRVLAMRYRRDIAASWIEGVPTLHLDATMSERLVRPFLPMAEFAPPVAAKLPDSVQARQVLRAPASARKLAPADWARDREKRTADGHVRRVAAYIAIRARAFAPGRVLVIAQKAAEARLREASLPANVELAHFGAIAGLDLWRDVRALILIGRTAPAPRAVEHIAVALTGRPVEPVSGRWYAKANRRIGLPKGRTVEVPADAHPDDLAEAVRWAICEAELVQAIGRARAVNRNAQTPLQIDVIGDVVLPLEVHEVAEWPDVEPTLLDVAALSGAVLTSAVDLATAFPDLFDGPRSAQRLIDEAALSVPRAGISDRFGYSNLYIAKTVTNRDFWDTKEWTRVVYRPEGRGQQTRTAWFDVHLISDPAGWLAERIGDLAACSIDGQSGDPERAKPDESRIATALRLHGVVPLAAREAADVLPGIWSSKSAADRDLTALDRAALAGEFASLVEVSYVREPDEGGRARERGALVAGAPHKARAIVEAVAGPLRAFEIVEVIGAPTPAALKAAAAARIGARVREFIEAATAPTRQVSRTAAVVDGLVEQAVSQARAVDGAAAARAVLARLAMASRAVVDGVDLEEADTVMPPDP